MFDNNHWLLKGLLIVARVKVANDVSEIAMVTNERACRQLLRYAQLGEECEYIADRLAAMTITPQDAVIELEKLVHKTIADAAPSKGKVRCPEILGGGQ
jgi:non-ribosomal peptide synthetase component E (peptide arylation enzyme)